MIKKITKNMLITIGLLTVTMIPEKALCMFKKTPRQGELTPEQAKNWKEMSPAQLTLVQKNKLLRYNYLEDIKNRDQAIANAKQPGSGVSKTTLKTMIDDRDKVSNRLNKEKTGTQVAPLKQSIGTKIKNLGTKAANKISNIFKKKETNQ